MRGEELALRGDESVPGHGCGWGGSKQPEAGGDGDESVDDGDALNPQCAVEIGFRGEFVTVGSGGAAHPFGDGFGLAAFDAGRFKLARGAECVEGAGVLGAASGSVFLPEPPMLRVDGLGELHEEADAALQAVGRRRVGLALELAAGRLALTVDPRATLLDGPIPACECCFADYLTTDLPD